MNFFFPTFTSRIIESLHAHRKFKFIIKLDLHWYESPPNLTRKVSPIPRLAGKWFICGIGWIGGCFVTGSPKFVYWKEKQAFVIGTKAIMVMEQNLKIQIIIFEIVIIFRLWNYLLEQKFLIYIKSTINLRHCPSSNNSNLHSTISPSTGPPLPLTSKFVIQNYYG